MPGGMEPIQRNIDNFNMVIFLNLLCLKHKQNV